jgi:hypothetical protein
MCFVPHQAFAERLCLPSNSFLFFPLPAQQDEQILRERLASVRRAGRGREIWTGTESNLSGQALLREAGSRWEKIDYGSCGRIQCKLRQAASWLSKPMVR